MVEFRLIPQKPFVIDEPFLAEYKLEKADEFLILACDGLWDEVDDQKAGMEPSHRKWTSIEAHRTLPSVLLGCEIMRTVPALMTTSPSL